VKVPFYCPEKAPIQGLLSARTAMGVPIGWWKRIRNLRWCNDAAIQVAKGPSDLSSAIVAHGLVRGMCSGYINGTYTLICAMRVVASLVTRMYYSTDNGVNWTEFSQPASYSDYKFATEGRVDFTVARHPARTTNPDLILAVNGTDVPRLLDVAAGYAFVHDEIAADDAISQAPVILKPKDYFDIQATTTHTNSAGGITAASTGTATNQEERITITNAVAAADTCTMQYTATISFNAANGRQFWLLAETAYREFFDNCQVSVLTSGGTEYVIYNPYSTTGDSYQAPVYVDYGGKGRFMVCFDASHLASIGTVTLNRIRFTWKGVAPSANRTVDLQCIAFSGLLQGATSVGNVRFNVASYSTSPSVVYANYKGARLREVGGPIDKHSRIPISTDMYYVYHCPYTNVSSAEISKGVTQVRLFIRRPGEFLYRFASSTTTGTQSTGAVDSGTVSLRDATAIQLSTRQSSNYEYIMPSAFHQSAPKSRCAHTAGGRTILGAIDTADYPGGVYFSELGNGFHFLVSPDNDLADTSATSIQFPNELPQTFLHSSISTFGSSAVYFWTNEALYQFSVVGIGDILRFSKLGPHGTIYPGSVAEHKTGVYWLDSDNQVRRLGNGIEPISQFKVDDLLLDASATLSVSVSPQGWAFGDRYYLAVSPTEDPVVTKNYSVLVYNTTLNQWESDDRISASKDVGVCVTHNTGTAKYPIYISVTDAKARRWEGDSSTAVSWSLKTGELHSMVGEPFGEFMVGRLWAIFDRHAGTMTSTRDYQPSAGQMPGTFTVTGSGRGWAFDAYGTANGVVRGKTCQISLSGSMIPTTKIYRLEAELEGRDGSGTS